MNLNKTFGRVATTLVAGAMLTALAMPTYADAEEGHVYEEPQPTQVITFNKTIEKPVDMYMPDATFKFNIEDYTDLTNVKTGAVEMTDDTIESAPAATDLTYDTITIANDTAAVTVDASKFEQPGEYIFTINEEAGTYETGYSWEAQSLNLKVSIIRDEDDNNIMKVYGYALYDAADPDTKLDGFTNEYYGGKDGTSHSFELTKAVSGNFATSTDLTTKHFTFNISIANSTLNGASKWYKVVVTHSSDCVYDGTDVAYIEANGTAEQIMLANTDKVKIVGLSGNETVTVKENDYASEGFNKVTYKVGSGNEMTLTADGFNVTGDANNTATVTNTKTATTPTGIVMNVAPYVLLVVVAAAGCFVFLRKRRED